MLPGIHPEDKSAEAKSVTFDVMQRRASLQMVEQQKASTILRYLKDGDSFGELPFLSHQPCLSTVKAQTYCEIMALGRTHYKAVLQMFPKLLIHAEGYRHEMLLLYKKQKRDAEAQSTRSHTSGASLAFVKQGSAAVTRKAVDALHLVKRVGSHSVLPLPRHNTDPPTSRECPPSGSVRV